MAEGFAEVIAETESPTLTARGITRPCISTAIVRSKALRETGLWQDFSCSAQILRVDALALGLVERSVVTYRDERGQSVPLRVTAIRDDSADPCLDLTLEEEPATS